MNIQCECGNKEYTAQLDLHKNEVLLTCIVCQEKVHTTILLLISKVNADFPKEK